MALPDAGYTRTEIAAKLDLPYHRVAGVLKRGGRQMPDQRPSVQAARIRALNSAQGEATRAKVLALDDEGRLRAEIAAELGLSPKYVAELLAGVGRTVSEAERIARSRAARNAQGAALRAEILALDDLGRSRQEIAEQLGQSYDHVCNVLVRAGRKAPVFRAARYHNQARPCRDCGEGCGNAGGAPRRNDRLAAIYPSPGSRLSGGDN